MKKPGRSNIDGAVNDAFLARLLQLQSVLGMDPPIYHFRDAKVGKVIWNDDVYLVAVKQSYGYATVTIWSPFESILRKMWFRQKKKSHRQLQKLLGTAKTFTHVQIGDVVRDGV